MGNSALTAEEKPARPLHALPHPHHPSRCDNGIQKPLTVSAHGRWWQLLSLGMHRFSGMVVGPLAPVPMCRRFRSSCSRNLKTGWPLTNPSACILFICLAAVDVTSSNIHTRFPTWQSHSSLNGIACTFAALGQSQVDCALSASRRAFR